MRTLLTKQQSADFVRENWRFQRLTFNWTTSRARDSYGYNICTLRDNNGDKIASTCGGGYDMKGTVLGEMINKYFTHELKKLVANSGSMDTPSGYYGLIHYNPNAKTHKRRFLKRATSNTRTYVDGGCGFESMLTILAKIGFKIQRVKEAKNSSTYILFSN